jgi:hypothetical protein
LELLKTLACSEDVLKAENCLLAKLCRSAFGKETSFVMVAGGDGPSGILLDPGRAKYDQVIDA